VVGHTVPRPYKVQLKLQFPVSLTILPDDLTARSFQLLPITNLALSHPPQNTNIVEADRAPRVGEGGVYSPHILKLGTRQRLVVAAYRGQFPYHEMPSAAKESWVGPAAQM
jgi:hypothetical protein